MWLNNEGARLAERPYEVSGMLLYTATDRDVLLSNSHYAMSGNRIIARMLDLVREFLHIGEPLDGIADGWLGSVRGQCALTL